MTGGIGFSRAGMDSSRNNRNLLKNATNRNFTQKAGTKGNNKIVIEKADPKVLAAIRKKTAKAQKSRKIVIIGLIVFTLMLLSYFVIKIL